LISGLLFTLFVVVPLVEIYVLVQVGQVIGAGWTILLLLADAILGTWLIRREGRRTWLALRDALDTGRMPATELADGALVLVGGTLLLTPGFLTDIVGFFLLLPFTRPIARKSLIVFATRWFGKAVVGPVGGMPPGFPPGFRPPGPPRPGQGKVLRGEVLDDDEGPGR
jgi:UPF0716 protein FxsA